MGEWRMFLVAFVLICVGYGFGLWRGYQAWGQNRKVKRNV